MRSAQMAKRVGLNLVSRGFVQESRSAPEHWLQPEEGALAIFPSYLWHGTEALQSDVERMTVGFDVLPATR